jgi:hypothetical protein
VKIACVCLKCSSAIAMTFLLCGCEQTQSPQYEFAKMEVENDYTNFMLMISTNASDGYTETTNLGSVTALEQAANIVGQYGWEFVGAGTEDGDMTYYFKRKEHPSSVGGEFMFLPDPSAYKTPQ